MHALIMAEMSRTGTWRDWRGRGDSSTPNTPFCVICLHSPPPKPPLCGLMSNMGCLGLGSVDDYSQLWNFDASTYKKFTFLPGPEWTAARGAEDGAKGRSHIENCFFLALIPRPGDSQNPKKPTAETRSGDGAPERRRPRWRRRSGRRWLPGGSRLVPRDPQVVSGSAGFLGEGREHQHRHVGAPGGRSAMIWDELLSGKLNQH